MAEPDLIYRHSKPFRLVGDSFAPEPDPIGEFHGWEVKPPSYLVCEGSIRYGPDAEPNRLIRWLTREFMGFRWTLR